MARMRKGNVTRKSRGVLRGLREHLGFGEVKEARSGAPVLRIWRETLVANVVWIASTRSLRVFWPGNAAQADQRRRDFSTYEGVARWLEVLEEDGRARGDASLRESDH